MHGLEQSLRKKNVCLFSCHVEEEQNESMDVSAQDEEFGSM